MVRREVELSASPTRILQQCADAPLAFALDGGGRDSWGCGRAVIGCAPAAHLRVAGGGGAVMTEGGSAVEWNGDPFELLERFRAVFLGQPPRAAVIVVALSYELRRWIERRRSPAPAAALPLLYAAAYPWALVYDYRSRRYAIVAATPDAAVAGERHVRAAMCRPLRYTHAGTGSPQANLTRAQYCDAVERALRYIAAGDIYQVNLAQCYSVGHAPPPAVLYAGMQRHAAPYAGYVDTGDCVLACNSPEAFLSIRDGTVTTAPIKGTRPRGCDAAADAALMHGLQNDPKECAEHVMIVDLERNDLGRVCRTGTVRVDRFMQLQPLPSLHHLVSRVTGELRPDATLAAVLRATFPGGSITGAPKIRAMEIIDALEPVAREYYTGAIGMLAADGRAQFNIAIRTAIVTGGVAAYHAGGGIVADSDPLREYEETQLKARPFFAALALPPP